MGADLTKRATHRGFILANNAAEQVVSLYASNYAVKTIERRGAPVKLYWPVMGDFQGAMLLVDAVMDRDYETITRLNARYPEFDFQLGDWLTALKEEHERKNRSHRKVIKRSILAHGMAFCIELETDSDTGERALWRALYRGKKLLSRELVATESDLEGATKPVEKQASVHTLPVIPKPATRKRKTKPEPEPEELTADPAFVTAAHKRAKA